MAENIKLEVVTPRGKVVDESVAMVVAPGILGEFGVLTGHTPFLTVLKPGALRFTGAADRDNFVFVSGGFAEALPNKVTVLAESAERRRDIDVDRAKLSAGRAEKRLSGNGEENSKDVDYERARASLFRALQRIRLVESI